MIKPTLSIIIPTLNEAETLSRTLSSCRPPEEAEIIVVDGGSSDGTPEIARQCGARLVMSRPGRGRQMNAGANQGRGEILLFLHGDTVLPEGYYPQVVRLLGTEGVAAGAFRLSIEGRSNTLRMIERVANLRAKFLQLPFGDQGFFVMRSVFERAGGFPEIPIMEDFDLIRALRRWGKIGLAKGSVLTSGRRWERLGPWRTTAVNQLAILAHLLRVSPDTIVRLYHQKGKV